MEMLQTSLLATFSLSQVQRIFCQKKRTVKPEESKINVEFAP